MKLRIGVSGAGGFSRSFIPLFKAHPLVDDVAVADLLPERAAEAARAFNLKRTFGSHEELCDAELDAVAIFTQRHLHGPQGIAALRAGKHVYCAVPISQSLDDIAEVIRLAEQTRLVYMMGETSYYYPSTLYCRARFTKGDFGRFVYGEAQYIHDMDHGFYGSFQRSGGAEWKRVAGIPPMLYPTHSVSMILSVTGARASQVSCLGWEDRHDDGVFRVGANLWDNRFSNEVGLMRTSDGGMMRIGEFRRLGWLGMNSVHMRFYGTEGSFEEHGGSQVWVGRAREHLTDVTQLLTCTPSIRHGAEPEEHGVLARDFHSGLSRVHPAARLPVEFKGASQRPLRLSPVPGRRLRQIGG